MTDTANGGGGTARGRIQIVDRTYNLLRLIFFLCFAGYAVHEVGVTIQAFAGEDTDANVIVGFVTGGSGFTITISATLNLGLLWWALGERRLRRRVLRQSTVRPRKLELRLDPNRSSSGLTSAGRTAPDDE